MWSGIRGSNSRPIPWQGIALPTELIPHCKTSRLLFLPAFFALFDRVWRVISEDLNYTPNFDVLARCCKFSSPAGVRRLSRGARRANWSPPLTLAAQAPMVKSVDTADLKSAACCKAACRFDPGSGHQTHKAPPGITRPALDRCRGDQEKAPPAQRGWGFCLSGGAARSRTGLDGFAIRCITALLPRHGGQYPAKASSRHQPPNSPEKKGSLFEASLWKMERDKRLELSTYTLARYRSTN